MRLTRSALTFFGASSCLFLIVGVETLEHLDGFLLSLGIGILSSLDCCFLADRSSDLSSLSDPKIRRLDLPSASSATANEGLLVNPPWPQSETWLWGDALLSSLFQRTIRQIKERLVYRSSSIFFWLVPCCQTSISDNLGNLFDLQCV